MAPLAMRAPAPRPTPLEVFALRCWARAYLWAYGELSLHDAVDGLEEYAAESGLISQIGQDAVQTIMAAEFGAYRC